MNEAGQLETWEYQGGTFTATGSWLAVGGKKVTELELKSYYANISTQENLIDPNKIVKGKFLGSTGISSLESLCLTYIPMYGKNVSFNGTQAGAIYLGACDKYGNITHINDTSVVSGGNIILYQENDEFAIVSCRITEVGVSAIAKYGDEIPIYEHYYGYFSKKEGDLIIKSANLILDLTFDYNTEATMGTSNKEVLSHMGLNIGDTLVISADGSAEWDNMIFQFRDTDNNEQRVSSFAKGEVREITATIAIDKLVLYYSATSEGTINISVIRKGEFSSCKKKVSEIEKIVSPTEGVDGSYIKNNSISVNKLDSTIISSSKNLFNPNDKDVVIGAYLAPSGNTVSSQNWITSGFIEFTEEMGILVASFGDGQILDGGGCCITYNEEKKVVKAIQNTECKGVLTWEECVKYARFSMRAYTIDNNIQVEIGDTISSYVPFGYFINESLIPKQPILHNLYSILGQEADKSSNDTLNDGESVVLETFPRYIKKGNVINFICKYSLFDKIAIGKGYQSYNGGYFVIDNANVAYKTYSSSETEVETVAHGLTFDELIKVSIFTDNNFYAHFILQSKNGTFTYIFKGFGSAVSGNVFVKSIGSTLSEIVLNASNSDFRFPVWAFGDSYFGMGNNRWPGVMKTWGYFNALFNGLAGQGSQGAYTDLIKCLEFGTPRYLLWCLGMNDSDDNFIKYFEIVRELCKDKGIIFIGATIPTVPTRNKEIISQHVRDNGERYIDFYKAVGTNSNGTWYDGYLNSDGVHPDPLGAEALAMQVLIDFPELMQYGITNFVE